MAAPWFSSQRSGSASSRALGSAGCWPSAPCPARVDGLQGRGAAYYPDGQPDHLMGETGRAATLEADIRQPNNRDVCASPLVRQPAP